MGSEMKTLSIDIETYSETDLPSCGVAKYVEDPAFEILLFGYSVGLPEIKLGEQYANSISTFNSHYELMGTVAALVCTLSFEQRPDRPKIKLTSSVK